MHEPTAGLPGHIPMPAWKFFTVRSGQPPCHGAILLCLASSMYVPGDRYPSLPLIDILRSRSRLRGNHVVPVGLRAGGLHHEAGARAHVLLGAGGVVELPGAVAGD